MNVIHLLNRGFKYLTNEDYRFCIQAGHGKYNDMSDEEYLKRMFKARLGYPLNLDDPQTFNEKLQWIKLFDRRPIYTTIVDKYEAKKYVANIIGDKYIIPTLGVWNSFEEIDFDSLPNQFVLKTTHDSGGVVIVKDKKNLNMHATKEKIEYSMNRNFYWWGREWPYKEVKPRIIAEKYMTDESERDLKDYKFFCFGGQARCFKTDYDRFIEYCDYHYNNEGNISKYGEKTCHSKYEDNLDIDNNTLTEINNIASKLSKSYSFLRTDFYDVDRNIYLGELTLYHTSEFDSFTDRFADELLDTWLELPADAARETKRIIFTDEIVGILRKKVETKKGALTDFKAFCFNGRVDSIMTCSDRNLGRPKFRFYDTNWQRLDYQRKEIEPKGELYKPEPLLEILEISQKLSLGFPELRVDLYVVNENIYFGELTIFDSSGFDTEITRATDKKWGRQVDLSLVRD